MTLQIIIPCAGEGRRFREAGYLIPKPFMDVAGKSMIARVMESLTPMGGCKFQLLDRASVGTTQGAVDTLLKANIDPYSPVLVANCDQLIHFAIDPFIWDAMDYDASLMTFSSQNPHHSYVATKDDLVIAIAEKEVISSRAVVGIYYFSEGQLLTEYAEKVIANNARYNGEFYVSEMFKLMVGDNRRVKAYDTAPGRVTMLGTPEELSAYLETL